MLDAPIKKTEITHLHDIKFMVDRFYASVRKDALLGPVFEQRIGDKWPEHLEKMYRFWQTILFEEHTYHGSPFRPHATMPIKDEHFDRWHVLFTETLDTYFEGEKAEEAKWRAEKMAGLFKAKLNLTRNGGSIMGH